MRWSNVSLRLPPHLLERLKRPAEQEETSVNQLVTLAVAEKPRPARRRSTGRAGRSAAGAGWQALERMG
jgi:hypothetical protein